MVAYEKLIDCAVVNIGLFNNKNFGRNTKFMKGQVCLIETAFPGKSGEEIKDDIRSRAEEIGYI